MNKVKIEALLAKAWEIQLALDEVIRMEEFDEAEYPTYEDEERFGSDGELEKFAQACRNAQDNLEDTMNALDKCINPQDYESDGDYSDIEGSDDDAKYNEDMSEFESMYDEESK